MSILSWFRRKASWRRESRIEFLREQDGEFERSVKEALVPLLRGRDDVARAYLACVGFQPTSAPSVALCIAGKVENPGAIAAAVGNLFKTLASRDIFLDVLFVRPDQEADLRRVCSAFYERTT